MKWVLAAAIAVPLIGLAIVGPFVVVLLVMIVPLIALAMFSGWGVAHGGERATTSRPPAEHVRHVVTR